MGEGNKHTFNKCMFSKLSSSVFIWHLHQNICKCHKEVIVKLQNQISEAYENIVVHLSAGILTCLSKHIPLCEPCCFLWLQSGSLSVIFFQEGDLC